MNSKFPLPRATVVGLAVALLPTTLGSVAQESVSSSELVREQGWELVRDNCTECHSSQIIVQNSGNRAVWKSRIEWMQDSQGLGELAPEVEESILQYLAANYGQKTASRRQHLPAHLMPANPNAQPDQ